MREVRADFPKKETFKLRSEKSVDMKYMMRVGRGEYSEHV